MDLEYLTLKFMDMIEKGDKLTFPNANKYIELVKQTFGDSEASGFLNLLIASRQVRNKQNPKDRIWRNHFNSYRNRSKRQKMLIDALSDTLLSKKVIDEGTRRGIYFEPQSGRISKP